MSILKQKVLACRLAKMKTSTTESSSPESSITSPSSEVNTKSQKGNKARNSHAKQRQRVQGSTITPKCYLQTKNIVTNFGKAIATFASSDLAVTYLIPLFHKQKENGHDIQIADFLTFVKQAKGTIGSIDGLKSLLLVKEIDEPREIAFKEVFQSIAEVFIKYFSVNWITHGRVTYKLEHLKFRQKMLRRVQNPELFFNLKNSKEKRAKKLKVTEKA